MSQQTPAQADLACSQCGRMFAHSDLVQVAGNWVCGDCKPAFLSRVMAGGPGAASPLGWHYGGFWMRFLARFIDNFMLISGIMAGVDQEKRSLHDRVCDTRVVYKRSAA